MDFTPSLSAGLNGALQGYILKKKQDLQDAQTAEAQAKAATTLGDQGYRIGESGAPEMDPGYVDPENISYKRAKQAANFHAMGAKGALQNYLTLEAVHSIRNPGKPLPAELQPYKDTPYDPKYDNLFTQGNTKPGDVLLSPEQQAEQERLTGMKAGSAKGMTVGQLAGTGKYVAGQNASAGRTSTVQDAENERLQQKIKADAARADADRASREKIASEKGTPASRGLDSAYAKDYSEYVLNGGHAKAMQDLAELEPLVGQLKNHDTGMLGGAAALLGDKAVDLQDPELASIRDKYKRSLTQSLKSIFGARVSQQEYLKQLELGYNPRLSPQENSARIQDQITRLKSVASAKKAAADYYEKNGTIAGFQGLGADGSDSDLGPDTSAPPPNPSALRAKAAKTGGAAVNGNVIPKKTLDSIRQFPTKGTASAPKEGAIKSLPNGENYRRQGGKWVQILPGEPTE